MSFAPSPLEAGTDPTRRGGSLPAPSTAAARRVPKRHGRVRAARHGLRALFALAIIAAGVAGAGCRSQARKLEEAHTLRHGGDAKGALEQYKSILADLGDGPLSGEGAAIRQKALKGAGDVSYLELGDYMGAISYYRRIISLYPGSTEARGARIAIGDIYRERFKDHLAAIAQYADVAASDAPEAPVYQLEVCKAYFELKNYRQVRTEARILLDRWPTHPLAEEAQLLHAQAWVLDKRPEEALSAFQALIDRHPRDEILARALEGQAHIHAQAGRLDRAIELYERALPIHPNPDAIRTNLAAVRGRKAKAMPDAPGDRASAFDAGKTRPGASVIP